MITFSYLHLVTYFGEVQEHVLRFQRNTGEVAAMAINHELSQDLLLQPREISTEQKQRFTRYLGEIFTALGLNLQTPDTERTPQRFLQALIDSTNGYEGDPSLPVLFTAPYSDHTLTATHQIIEGPIPFYALCEHHAFPFSGFIYLGYIGQEHIIGLSKLTRLVRVFARRFTVQERLGEQLASALDALLTPHGVAVYVTAQHLCKQMRGVNESTAVTHTLTWRGAYEQQPALRNEFLMVCSGKRM